MHFFGAKRKIRTKKMQSELKTHKVHDITAPFARQIRLLAQPNVFA
jgi:hypothetical protein